MSTIQYSVICHICIVAVFFEEGLLLIFIQLKTLLGSAYLRTPGLTDKEEFCSDWDFKTLKTFIKPEMMTECE